MNECLSREETMRLLRLSERELMLLVAKRELPALRDKNTTKFRREDVARVIQYGS